MINRWRALLLIVVIITAIAIAQDQPPANGYVPDEVTAVRVAEAVLIPIYGEKRVRSERPFRAKLEGDTWMVKGTLPKAAKPGYVVVGGTMTAEIERMTGCIRAVYHMK